MVVILIIFLIILYFFIGYVVTKLFENYDVVNELDDELIFILALIFFPFVTIGVFIKWAGTKITDFITNKIDKD